VEGGDGCSADVKGVGGGGGGWGGYMKHKKSVFFHVSAGKVGGRTMRWEDGGEGRRR
jgi:hypothetical protein